MSDKGTVSPKEKESAEKRGRGRPRKQPQVKTSDVSTFILTLIWVLHVMRLSLPETMLKKQSIPSHLFQLMLS